MVLTQEQMDIWLMLPAPEDSGVKYNWQYRMLCQLETAGIDPLEYARDNPASGAWLLELPWLQKP